jgi:hypothetical protein
MDLFKSRQPEEVGRLFFRFERTGTPSRTVVSS